MTRQVIKIIDTAEDYSEFPQSLLILAMSSLVLAMAWHLAITWVIDD